MHHAVAVPSLLLNEKQVRALVNDLEVRFLANRDPHLHFALLTDLPDSVSKPHAKRRHPLVDLPVNSSTNSMQKYGSQKKAASSFSIVTAFLTCAQGVWMGWERKRGKLLDLNKLLASASSMHSPSRPAARSAAPDPLRAHARLRHAAAARRRGTLIGAIAHPLHQAVIDPKLRIVTEGYGILQPRIGVSVRSASRSRMAAIYSGPERLRHLHARHLRRLPGPLWRRHLHRQGHL
jgi:cyclic beta-1,2-glucan synthetase